MSDPVITFIAEADRLLLKYQPSGSFDQGIVGNKLKTDGEATVRKVFTFLSTDQIQSTLPEDFDNREYAFELGKTDSDYYRIDKRFLDLKHDLLLSKQMPINHKILAPRYIKWIRV